MRRRWLRRLRNLCEGQVAARRDLRPRLPVRHYWDPEVIDGTSLCGAPGIRATPGMITGLLQNCPGTAGDLEMHPGWLTATAPTTGLFTVTLDADLDSASTRAVPAETSPLPGCRDTLGVETLELDLVEGEVTFIYVDGCSNSSDLNGPYTLTIEAPCVPNVQDWNAETMAGGSCGTCADGRMRRGRTLSASGGRFLWTRKFGWKFPSSGDCRRYVECDQCLPDRFRRVSGWRSLGASND